MKKSFLLISLLFIVFSGIKAQTVLDRVLLQGKFAFNSTTWIDTSDTKYYYDSLGLMVRTTSIDLRATTPALFEIDSNSYDSARRLKQTNTHYLRRGSSTWVIWLTEEFSYNGNLLNRRVENFINTTNTHDYAYNTDSTLKEINEIQRPDVEFRDSFFYNSSKQLTKRIKVRKGSVLDKYMEKDTFIYVGAELAERINYKWIQMTKSWDTWFIYKYTYNTNGTLKEKIEQYYEFGNIYDNYRSQYFYKTLSTSLDGVNKIKAVNIYPNPSSGKFTVELGDMETSTITITDVTGKQVYRTEASDNVDVNLSHLQKGIYLVNIKSKENSSTQRIVIQ